ncbi:MAG: right-handed parallel beta-helix repeat-containing protein [Bacteroidota bacterium]|nr:right-handed parallel beta-helix repeat-containing protein [Bacteroidota bacterium]
MKRNILVTGLLMVCGCLNLQAADIWVSPQGNDLNDGSMYHPKASLLSAFRQARELRRLNDPSVQGGIHILMKGGIYYLSEPLLVRPEDSGTPESPTIVEAVSGETPVLSGGVLVEHWKPVSGKVKGLKNCLKKKIWVADVPSVNGQTVDFRQVWVNGNKAMAASNSSDSLMLRIMDVDYTNKAIRIPDPGVKKFVKPCELELFIHQMWGIALLRVQSVESHGKTLTLRFYQPESRLEFEQPWPQPVLSAEGNSPFRLSGAIEWLDEPGEWYHDRSAGKLYYYPRANEQMKEAEVVVPFLETLVTVLGSKEHPVSDLHWKGVTFAHCGWLRPSRQGYVPLQAGMYLLDAYPLQVPGTPDKATLENQAWIGRQPAAVQLQDVRNTSFEGCYFVHTGAGGLDFVQGSSCDTVEGCQFNDIAGSALIAGKFSDACVETHVPYNPYDTRELCRQLTIRNNLIHDVANEYWGCPGILAGYVRDVTIEHNELYDLSYSGIGVGWGWTRTINCMVNNRIHANLVYHFGKHNYHCGGIYTLSSQPGTTITGNCIRDICRPSYVSDKKTGYYIYLDEASGYLSVRDNWCTEANIGYNQNGPLEMGNNGPQVPETIKANAGISSTYKRINE